MRVKMYLVPVLTLWLFACSGPRAYRIGQEWQNYECSRISDARERSQCMEKANMPYEEYQEGIRTDP